MTHALIQRVPQPWPAERARRPRSRGRLVLWVGGLAAVAAVAAPPAPAWAAFPGSDGRIVYTADDGSSGCDSAQLFSVLPDGSGRQQVTHLTGYSAFWPAASADGRTIAFQRHSCTSADHVFLIDSNGSHLRSVPYDATIDSGEPALSPDGTKIAMLANIGDATVIAVVNVDGTGLTALTDGSLSSVLPRWSPDGNHIVFVGTSTDGFHHRAIYSMNADGSGRVQLTPFGLGALHPDYSPDGRQIVFDTKRSADSGLFVMNADGSGIRQLTHPGPNGVDFFARFAPAGDRIAYSADHTGCCDLFTVRVDGTDVRQLTSGNPPFDLFLDWEQAR